MNVELYLMLHVNVGVGASADVDVELLFTHLPHSYHRPGPTFALTLSITNVSATTLSALLLD